MIIIITSYLCYSGNAKLSIADSCSVETYVGFVPSTRYSDTYTGLESQGAPASKYMGISTNGSLLNYMITILAPFSDEPHGNLWEIEKKKWMSQHAERGTCSVFQY
jgi:hypothetical protein